MSRLFAFFALCASAVVALSAVAQGPHEYVVYEYDDAAATAAQQESEECEAPAEAEGPTCDCLWCRENLLGDVHGLRSSLAEHGILWDGQLTQFHQGVADGGNEQVFKYGGKLDQFVIFEFAKMGLCEHLTGVMHTETRFGETVIGDAVLLAPVNTNMLYPKLGQNDTAITGMLFELALTDELALTAGRINALDLWKMLYPQTGRGVDAFMNTSIVLPLTLGRTVPLVTNGAGVMKKQGQQIQGAVLVYDSNNVPTTSGFDELFDNGANVLGLWRIFTDCGGRPGSHAVVGTWASGDFTSLDPIGWSIIPGQGVVAPVESGSWSVNYILEQQLWVDCCNEKRNIGLLSQWGYADAETSPYEWVANVSLQGQGLVCCRENDTLGAGYFYTGLSNDFKNLLAAVAPVDDLQGVEFYYNAEVTPWFHLTADLQIVEPALQANDTAVVFGLRGKIDL